MRETGRVPAAGREYGEPVSDENDLDAAAREIDAVIATGDVERMEAWLDANRERHVRAKDAARLFEAIRARR